jgi:energy-coupling factor transporter transmembrane protein EcfT
MHMRMDPTDPLRPDTLAEPSPWRWLWRLVPILLPIVLVPLFAFYFGFEDALIRPFALGLGKSAIAVISGKRVSHGRASGNYIQVNYQYAPDYSPRPEVKVNDAAYAAIAKYSNVPIHYIPGCSSCVALDEDFGSAREQAVRAMIIGAVAGLMVFLRSRPRT